MEHPDQAPAFTPTVRTPQCGHTVLGKNLLWGLQWASQLVNACYLSIKCYYIKTKASLWQSKMAMEHVLFVDNFIWFRLFGIIHWWRWVPICRNIVLSVKNNRGWQDHPKLFWNNLETMVEQFLTKILAGWVQWRMKPHHRAVLAESTYKNCKLSCALLKHAKTG